jgi:hypothetical protein
MKRRRYIKMSTQRPLQDIFCSHVENFAYVLPRLNIKRGQLTKEHNFSPYEYQQNVEKPAHQQLQRYCGRVIFYYVVFIMH